MDAAASKYQAPPEGFHIVMESAPLSEAYLLNYLEIMKGFSVEMGSVNKN